MALSDLPGTQTGLYELHRTFTVAKIVFSDFPSTQTGLHELHRTSTAVKIAFSVLPGTQTGEERLRAAFAVFAATGKDKALFCEGACD